MSVREARHHPTLPSEYTVSPLKVSELRRSVSASSQNSDLEGTPTNKTVGDSCIPLLWKRKFRTTLPMYLVMGLAISYRESRLRGVLLSMLVTLTMCCTALFAGGSVALLTHPSLD